MKSPLRYPGGKSRAVNDLLKLIPQSVDIVSPFIGGGSVEIALAQRGQRVHGYDAFRPLVAFWRTLLWRPKALADAVRRERPLSKERFKELQKTLPDIRNQFDAATAFFALNRASFSGATCSGGMALKQERFTESAIKRLEQFRSPTLSVAYRKFQFSLRAHKDEFAFCDPPYMLGNSASRLYGNRGDMHCGFDHVKLANILRKRGRWILCYNDCEGVRELYDGSDFVEINWAYGMNKTRKSNEILIAPKGEVLCRIARA